MLKILFVCHGNICRSPMAEFVMKKLVAERGLENEFEIASAATSTEEIGNDIYPPAKKCLTEHNIPFSPRSARQMTRADYAHYDLIFCMDIMNIRNLRYILGEGQWPKVNLLLDRDVADPWYTGNFEATYKDVVEGCKKIFEKFYPQK